VNIDAQEQATVKIYQLGQLPQNESELLEERLLSDNTFYEQLSVVEDELIEQYLDDSLSAEEKAKFETHFLVPKERQEKLRFARLLKRYVDAEQNLEPALAPSPSRSQVKKTSSFSFFGGSPVLSYSLIAALVLVVFGVGWMFLRNAREVSQGRVLSVALAPGLTRDVNGRERVSVARDVGTVHLRLQISNAEYDQFRVRVLEDNRQVLAEDGLGVTKNPDGDSIDLNVPARLLNTGDYRIQLSGRIANGSYEDVATYSLSIAR
jgi:hypothetical protein